MAKAMSTELRLKRPTNFQINLWLAYASDKPMEHSKGSENWPDSKTSTHIGKIELTVKI